MQLTCLTAGKCFRSSKSTTYDPYSSMIVTNVYSNGTWMMLFHHAYTQPGVMNPPILKSILAISSLFSTLRQATHGNLTDAFEAGSPVTRRPLFSTITFSNSESFIEIFFQLANATAAVMTSETLGLDFTLSYQPWPQTITSDGRQNGGNILRINAADSDLTNVDINLYWDRAIDDEFV